MVIVFSGAGNHSNRLFQNIHYEAFCIENRIRYINPSLWDKAKFYGLKSKSFSQPICFILQNLNKAKLLKTLDCNNLDEMKKYEDYMRGNQLVLAQGWDFRVPTLTTKYQDFFINKYSLLPVFYKENSFYKTFSQINRKEFEVIGVHIRRGDYRYWQNGKYYFSDDVYQNYMDNLTEKVAVHSHKKPFFIIFSNEPVSLAQRENMLISHNEWYIDHMLMSQCDRLIGPPSTFSLWASYIGKVNYYHFKDGSGIIHWENFSLCKS